MSDENRNNKNNIYSKSNDKKKSSSENNVVFYNSNPKPKKTIPQQHINSSSGQKNIKYTPKKRKLPKQRIILNIVSVFVATVMIICGSGCLVAYAYFTRINYQTLDDDTNTESSISNTSQTSSEDNNGTVSQSIVEPYYGELLNDPMVLNIMLFGDDSRSNESTGNSDTMILISIDTKHEKIKMLSLLRDTYVSIPGYGENKINAAYSIGGAALAIQTFESNFGIHVDRYAIVNFNSFTDIIDVLGGIDIELTDEEIDYINWQCWKNHQVDTRNELDISSYTFYENEDGEMVATVHLNSRQALWHARNRGQNGICSGDDFTRTERQRNVVSTIINDLKDADLATILSVIYEIGPMITTNLKTSEITSLAGNVMKYLDYDIISQSMPEYSSFGTTFIYDKDINKLDIIRILDWNVFRQETAEFIYEDSVVNVTESAY